MKYAYIKWKYKLSYKIVFLLIVITYFFLPCTIYTQASICCIVGKGHNENEFCNYCDLADPTNFVPLYLHICLSFAQAVYGRQQKTFPVIFKFFLYTLS